MVKYVVHLMHSDKFTVPLTEKLNLWFEKDQHAFLFIGDDVPINGNLGNVFKKIKSPLVKNFFYNSKLIFKEFVKADVIVLHGIPIIFYFVLFPFAIKKIAWIIYGGTDLYLYSGKKLKFSERITNEIRKYVLKRVRRHISHIEGDSEIANSLYHSKAEFIYSQVYLSNVVDLKNFPLEERKFSQPINIMVGHSTDTSNNHLEIFDWLKPFSHKDMLIYCPLSYGNYLDYKIKVIAKGKELFGDKFIPIETFMTPNEYSKWLNNIDIAIFNHKRQEAMGVTLTLLSLGKIVYINPNTSSFKSFKKRGIKIFSNELLKNHEEFFFERSIKENKVKLMEYYTEEVLHKSWFRIYSISTN